MESKSCVSSLMGIRTIRQGIEVQPTQTHSDVDWVGLSMIINALRQAVVPTQIHSDVDWVGSSMIKTTLRGTVEPTQTRSDGDWVGSSMIKNDASRHRRTYSNALRCGLSRLAMIKNDASRHRRTYSNALRCRSSRLVNFAWVQISALIWLFAIPDTSAYSLAKSFCLYVPTGHRQTHFSSLITHQNTKMADSVCRSLTNNSINARWYIYNMEEMTHLVGDHWRITV